MKKVMFIILLCMGTATYAQNHLTVNGVTLGQEFREVAESLKKSYPNSRGWDGTSNEIFIYNAYLGNINITSAKFYSRNGRLAECVFYEIAAGIEGPNVLDAIIDKYKQLVQQFASKYGQPYVTEGKNEIEIPYQMCSWQVGADRITIKVDYQAPIQSRYSSYEGSASVEVRYIYGSESYHGF